MLLLEYVLLNQLPLCWIWNWHKTLLSIHPHKVNCLMISMWKTVKHLLCNSCCTVLMSIYPFYSLTALVLVCEKLWHIEYVTIILYAGAIHVTVVLLQTCCLTQILLSMTIWCCQSFFFLLVGHLIVRNWYKAFSSILV